MIEIPALFHEENTRYVAHTPGSVNMLVITTGGGTHLAIPKPFGPVDAPGPCAFELDMQAKLAPHATLHFIDDFNSYHTGYGELHCGTNSLRTPPPDRWWDLTWI